MKNLISLSALLAFGTFAHADETAKAAPCPDGKCPVSECAKACSGKSVSFVVSGLQDEAVAAKAAAAIAALDGAEMCHTCCKSGTFSIKYDPAKIKVAALEQAVAASGLEITGQKSTFNVKGMSCISCANHITSLLGKTPGVTSVDKVDHMTGETAVTFDPKKTDEEKIKAVIAATRYKIVEAPAASQG